MSNDIHEPLTPDNAVVLLLDHQTGIMLGVGDITPAEFRNDVLAFAKVARAFGLPTVLSTSFEDGPNGPLLPEIRELFPDVPVIARPGEINAWDHPDVVAAVERTGRRKLIVAGVTTDVCLTFPALAATRAGYEVFAVVDASGTWNTVVQQAAMHRMSAAGVILTSWVSVAAELTGDWRTPAGQHMAAIFQDHLVPYGMIMRNFAAARSSIPVRAGGESAQAAAAEVA
jgi:nicotinamidase-related amidase